MHQAARTENNGTSSISRMQPRQKTAPSAPAHLIISQRCYAPVFYVAMGTFKQPLGSVRWVIEGCCAIYGAGEDGMERLVVGTWPVVKWRGLCARALLFR